MTNVDSSEYKNLPRVQHLLYRKDAALSDRRVCTEHAARRNMAHFKLLPCRVVFIELLFIYLLFLFITFVNHTLHYKTRTKTYNEIQYITTAGFPQQ